MKNNSSHGNLFFAEVPLALHWSISEDLYFVHVRYKTQYIPKDKKAYLKIISDIQSLSRIVHRWT